MKSREMREHLGVFTTVEMLKNTASKYGDKVAMRIFRNKRYEELTYAEVDENVDRLAAGLIKLGVSPEDRVSVLGENRPEWAIAYLAIHRAGAVGVPLDSLQKAPEFRHIMTDANVRCVVVSERFLPELLEAAEPMEGLTIICMDGANGDGVLNMSDVMTDEAPEAWPRRTLEDLAVIIYTSGTTGQSKGVMLSHGNLGSDVAGGYAINIMGFEDTFLSVLPLHHTFECTGGFLIPIYSGATITYARSLKSRDIIEDIKNTKVTLMLGVPLLFEKMMQGIQRKLQQAPLPKRALLGALFGIEKAGSVVGMELGGTLFKSLREKAGMESLGLMIAGGAALAPHVADWFNRLGFALIQGYGLTETSPITNVSLPWDFDFASVGPPLPGCEINIVDEDEDGNGEILVRGPMVMMGYYKNEEATREVLSEDGWLRTGDAGFVNERGWLYITGRKKNVIVTPSGKNVYPEEVEHHINQSPYVLESLVIGKPLPGSTSEEVHAMVVPNYEYFDEVAAERETPFTTEEIQSVVRGEVESAIAGIADYKRPKRFEIRDEEFEKTSTKKIKRFLYKQKDIPV